MTDTNLKPFLASRTAGISYKEPKLFDLSQTRSNLLALLSKLRTYFASNTFHSRITTLNSLTHQSIKQNIHDTLNTLIETYVNHTSGEKIEECLNSLSKTSFTEENRNHVTGFYQRLKTNVLDPLSNILELLQISEGLGDILEGDSDSAEVKARKILLAILYNIHVTKQRPLSILTKYCHINHQNLLKALTRESLPLPQTDLVEATDFSMDKFRTEYLEESEELNKVVQSFDHAAATKSARELLETLKTAINEVSSSGFNAEYALTDANVKLDYIQGVDKEELKTALRRSLESLLRDQVEEKSTSLLQALEVHLKEVREEFSKLKDYFQARDESKTHQKLINGSFEHDLVETSHYETSKALHTIKIYEDLMLEIFLNLGQLEKADEKYSETNQHISQEVKKLFDELLESAKKSLAASTSLGIFKEDLLLDEAPFLAILHELVEKANPNPLRLSERVNVNAVQEKLGLVAKEIEDEHALKNPNFHSELFGHYKQQATPFYLYNVSSHVLILQVLDLSQNHARIFFERKEDLENSNLPSSVQKVHLVIHQDLKRTLELLVECYNIKANKSHDVPNNTIRSIVLTLALFVIDAHTNEHDNIHEFAIEKRHIQEFIASHKIEKLRKVPEEKPQIQEPAESVNPQVEEPQVEKTEAETVQEQQPVVEEEAKPEPVIEEVKPEPVEEQKVEENNTKEQEATNETEAEVQKEEPAAPIEEETAKVESAAEAKETQEEAKIEEAPTQDTSEAKTGDEEQEEADKEEAPAAGKEGGQAAGGASKNKKKNKKKKK